jgi:hypothetical protein
MKPDHQEKLRLRPTIPTKAEQNYNPQEKLRSALAMQVGQPTDDLMSASAGYPQN